MTEWRDGPEKTGAEKTGAEQAGAANDDAEKVSAGNNCVIMRNLFLRSPQFMRSEAACDRNLGTPRQQPRLITCEIMHGAPPCA